MIGGGRSLGHARGSIEIETSQLEGVSQTARKVGADTQRALQQISTGARDAEQSFSAVGAAARTAGAFIAAHLTRRTLEAGVEMARASARAAGMRQEFQNLTGLSAEATERAMQTMRRASWGLISDFELVAQANRALLFGVVDDVEDMERLLQIASARAAAMGTTTEQAFDDLVRGIGRLSVEVLDNLGFTVSMTNAYERYAETTGKVATELTEVEKRQAVLNLLYEQAAEQIERQAELGETNAGNLERAAIAAENARVAFGQVIEQDVVEATLAYAWALGLVTRLLGLLRQDDQSILGSTGIEGYFTKARMAAREANREFDAARGQLESAQAGLAVLQDQADKGLVDESAVQRQIRLVADLTRQVEELGLAANTARGRLDGALVPSIGAPRLGPSGFGVSAAGDGAASAGPSQELLSAQRDFYTEVQSIERNAANDRLRTTEQYEQQRSETVAAYARSRAREEEDFARRRAQAVAQHEQQIARVREDAHRREIEAAADLAERIAGLREQLTLRQADAQEDFDRRIAELRENGAERIAEMEEAAQRDRERALRQHQDTLLNAASRLDARAVAQEQRRFAIATAEQEEQLQERLENERENLEERIRHEEQEFERRRQREERDLQRRIDQEQRAHAKRLEDARAADDRRIQDMQKAFDDQIEQEDTERGIRLQRQAEDHDLQMQQMARAHGQRMIEIDRQEGERLQTLKDAFEDQLTELGLYNLAWRNRQAEHQRLATQLFDDMWDDWRDTMIGAWEAAREAATAPLERSPFDEMTPDAGMGFTGGTSYTPPRVTSSNRSTHINMAPGTIVINESRRVGQTGQEVEDAMIRLLERLN